MPRSTIVIDSLISKRLLSANSSFSSLKPLQYPSFTPNSALNSLITYSKEGNLSGLKELLLTHSSKSIQNHETSLINSEDDSK